MNPNFENIKPFKPLSEDPELEGEAERLQGVLDEQGDARHTDLGEAMRAFHKKNADKAARDRKSPESGARLG